MLARTLQFRPVLALIAICLGLSACSVTPRPSVGAPSDPHYKIGKPYKINGKWYHPKEDPDYEEVGIASWYGRDFHGRMTANGEIYDMTRLSAAHTTMPLPSMAEVTNLKNGRSTVVRVNDRGPFAHNRIIDLSREAARELGFEGQGLAKVRVKYLGRAPLQAKAPSRGERVRVAVRAEEAAPPAPEPQVTAEAPTAPSIKSAAPAQSSGAAKEPSDLIAAMEEAPALTEGAEAAIIAEAQSPEPGPVEVPTSDMDARPAEQTRMVEVTPGAEVPQRVEALYLVRVASLSGLENIEDLRRELEPIGPLRMSRVELDDDRVFYRINMGPFASLETAAERLEAVRAAGYKDAAMVTLSP